MTEVRVDFSFRREVFFVVIGAIVGAIVMVVPKTIFEVGMGLPYYLTWIVFGRLVGVYSSASVFAGMALHMATAVTIGTVVGIFLYKSGILNISKLSNGLLYGLFAGFIVFVVFFIPVQQLLLGPEIARILAEIDNSITESEAAHQISNNLLTIMLGSIVMHLVFGAALGIFSSALSIKFGSRYRCAQCDISFSRIDSHQKHMELVHGAKPIQLTKILILGGGFGGVEVLQKLQNVFQNDVGIDITLVSKDNFFLFTPMLPEVSSGMIETRHIVTPVRVFCKRARFYEANVQSIDLEKKEIMIAHVIGRQTNTNTMCYHKLEYDYLVLAMGSKTNFFGMQDVEMNSFTIKSVGDAMAIRNHVINMLEQADMEHENSELKKTLMTFVVVGGGFAGVETVGELNDFLRDSIKDFYHNIDEKDIRIILVNAGGRLLPEVSDDLAEFGLQKLRESGVEVMLNTRVASVTTETVTLSSGLTIPTHTTVWTGGITSNQLIANLQCDHDKSGRIVVNNNLELPKHPGVFSIGDSACVMDPNTGKPYPPTAQHALRQGSVCAYNIVSAIKGRRKIEFSYKTKGMMAKIGKRNGVGILFGYKVQGFAAWWMWRSYYLANLPTADKKLRVMADWAIDLFFRRDVTRLKTLTEERESEKRVNEVKTPSYSLN